jgi:hypothetical protein
LVNGYLFTVPKGRTSRVEGEGVPDLGTGQIQMSEPARLMSPPPSVVESTTNLLEQHAAGVSSKRRDTH